METRTFPVVAVAFDGPVEPAACGRILAGSPRTPLPSGVEIELAHNQRLYVFHFGAVLLIGAESIEGPLAEELVRATGRALLPRTSDSYTFVVDPKMEAGRPRVDWDRVAIPEERDELISAAVLLLAQSAALERFEQKAEELLEQALDMARTLRDTGRPPRQTRALVSRIGHITSERLAMSSWFYLEDRPEPTWRDAGVSSLYDALFENLEMEARRKAMLHKLDEVESATQVMIDLAHGRESHLLEWAVVLLIVFEVVLTLTGIGDH
jgi:uncharacterized Rmd1/YagE family protein